MRDITETGLRVYVEGHIWQPGFTGNRHLTIQPDKLDQARDEDGELTGESVFNYLNLPENRPDFSQLTYVAFTVPVAKIHDEQVSEFRKYGTSVDDQEDAEAPIDAIWYPEHYAAKDFDFAAMELQLAAQGEIKGTTQYMTIDSLIGMIRELPGPPELTPHQRLQRRLQFQLRNGSTIVVNNPQSAAIRRAVQRVELV